MAKYLILWEVNAIKLSDKPEKRYENWTMTLNIIKKELENSIVDWGTFDGRFAGYYISEGTEQGISLSSLKYTPYVKFKVYPMILLDQALKNIKAM